MAKSPDSRSSVPEPGWHSHGAYGTLNVTALLEARPAFAEIATETDEQRITKEHRAYIEEVLAGNQQVPWSE